MQRMFCKECDSKNIDFMVWMHQDVSVVSMREITSTFCNSCKKYDTGEEMKDQLSVPTVEELNATNAIYS